MYVFNAITTFQPTINVNSTPHSQDLRQVSKSDTLSESQISMPTVPLSSTHHYRLSPLCCCSPGPGNCPPGGKPCGGAPPWKPPGGGNWKFGGRPPGGGNGRPPGGGKGIPGKGGPPGKGGIGMPRPPGAESS
jgi:hypothetical protein